MTTTLDACAARFRSGHDRVRALVAPLSDAVSVRRSAPGVWSPVEVVEHLNVIALADLPVMEAAVAGAPATHASAASAPLRLGIAGSLFVRSVQPSRLRVPTLRGMTPPPGERSPADVRAALSTFDSDTARFVALAESGRDVSRLRAASPFVPWLRMPLAAMLLGLAEHVHRHADQIERGLSLPAR